MITVLLVKLIVNRQKSQTQQFILHKINYQLLFEDESFLQFACLSRTPVKHGFSEIQQRTISDCRAKHAMAWAQEMPDN